MMSQTSPVIPKEPGMRSAVILLAILPLQAPDTAGRRLRGEAHAIGARVREPRAAHNSGVGRLDESAFRVRAAEVARELAGDLVNPTLAARFKYDALMAL